MGPKIEAAVGFVRKTGKRAVIASIEDIESAVRRESGTEIVNS
jgi:carbamate kinase